MDHIKGFSGSHTAQPTNLDKYRIVCGLCLVPHEAPIPGVPAPFTTGPHALQRLHF